MNKYEILKAFEKQVAADLAVTIQAAHAAHEAATHSESKAEDQYDTRALEAGYLAGAQSKRAMELEELLILYRTVGLRTFDEKSPISATALVELEEGEKHFYYFLMPLGGGRSVTHEGRLIQVVTPISPLGEALLGKQVGDDVGISVQNKERDFVISAIW